MHQITPTYYIHLSSLPSPSNLRCCCLTAQSINENTIDEHPHQRCILWLYVCHSGTHTLRICSRCILYSSSHRRVTRRTIRDPMRTAVLKFDNIKPLRGLDNYETWACQVGLILFAIGAKETCGYRHCPNRYDHRKCEQSKATSLTCRNTTGN